MKVKDMKRKFRFFTIKYWKEYIKLRHILKCIIKAKNQFIKDRSKPNTKLYGMCYYLGTELSNDDLLLYHNIKNIIPIFTPEYFHESSDKRYAYWWDINDIYSRIGAFDKLINYYKELIKSL